MSHKRYKYSLFLSALFVLIPHTSFADSLTDLEQLIVKEESTTTYQRSLFKHWIDSDKDCFDTRVEVLIDESTTWPSFKSRCKVAKGNWKSVYDNKTITDSSLIDIDHLVPLQEAWQSGADQWSNKQRQDYANELKSKNTLIAVSSSSNRSKGSKEPHNWLPVSEYVCQYLNDWVDVKKRWGLSVDNQEKEFLKNSLTTCTNGSIPTGSNYTPKSNSTNNNNSSNTKTSGPVVSETGAPAGSTAKCKDGTYSFSKTRSGTCSRHGGVAEWLTN
jgi:hypothetical protein